MAECVVAFEFAFDFVAAGPAQFSRLCNGQSVNTCISALNALRASVSD